ncbi:MAG TPA: hypothetical protein VFK07_03640 [Candidatus Paceibacterota bacterium]|nr:hypothetical protein [Candidatus Paceibacterota bacterium]
MNTAQVLRDYQESNSLSIQGLAKFLGVPRSTARDWLKGKKPHLHSTKKLLLAKFPQLAEDLNETSVSVSAEESALKAKPEADPNFLAARIESAYASISHLSVLAKWFLFQASPEDRNRFRTVLGEDWKDFTKLVTAMYSERALQAAREQGELDKWSI